MAILTEDGFIDPITAPKQLIELRRAGLTDDYFLRRSFPYD